MRQGVSFFSFVPHVKNMSLIRKVKWKWILLLLVGVIIGYVLCTFQGMVVQMTGYHENTPMIVFQKGDDKKMNGYARMRVDDDRRSIRLASVHDWSLTWNFRKDRSPEISPFYFDKNKNPNAFGGKSLVFCGIAKNAISLWKMVFLRALNGSVDNWWLTKQSEIHAWETGLNDHRMWRIGDPPGSDPYRVSRVMNDPSILKAVFIRDPLERALSGYLDKAYLFKKEGLTWNGFPNWLVKKYIGEQNHGNSLIIRGWMGIDQHFRPQSLFCDLRRWIHKYNVFSFHDPWDRKRFIDKLDPSGGFWKEIGKSGWSPVENGTLVDFKSPAR